MGTVLAFLFVFYVVLPLVASHRTEVATLTHIHPGFLVLGVLLEVAALGAYAQLTHAVLPHGGPRRLRLFRINLATLSLSHVAPGGTAPGAALGYRLLTQSGVSPSDAGFALGTQGIGSALVLNVLFWVSLVGFLATHGLHAPGGHGGAGSTPGSVLVAVAAVVGALLVLVFALAAWLATRGPVPARRAIARLGRRLPGVDPERLLGFFDGLVRRFHDLVADRALTRRAIGWAAANWVLDAASLWVFVAAFGHLLSPVDLLCAYGLANILAAVPLTPAGLGVVELVLVSMITGMGPTAGQALSGVLAYRAVNFWLPIPVGGMAYASLELERRGVLHRLRPRRLHTARPVPHDGLGEPAGAPPKPGPASATAPFEIQVPGAGSVAAAPAAERELDLARWVPAGPAARGRRHVPTGRRAPGSSSSRVVASEPLVSTAPAPSGRERRAARSRRGAPSR